MSSSALPIRLRLGAAALLASLLPLVMQAPMLSGSAEAPPAAAWLEAQVQGGGDAPTSQGRTSQAIFDRALAEAKAADARTLHGFLTAFLDAHARLADVPPMDTEGRSCQALIQALRGRLVRTGLMVHPLMQASAPPAVPERLGRWVRASLFGPLPERTAALGVDMRSLASSLHGLGIPLQWRVAPVARGSLIRVLFAGRLLGP